MNKKNKKKNSERRSSLGHLQSFSIGNSTILDQDALWDSRAEEAYVVQPDVPSKVGITKKPSRIAVRQPLFSLSTCQETCKPTYGVCVCVCENGTYLGR